MKAGLSMRTGERDREREAFGSSPEILNKSSINFLNNRFVLIRFKTNSNNALQHWFVIG